MRTRARRLRWMLRVGECYDVLGFFLLVVRILTESSNKSNSAYANGKTRKTNERHERHGGNASSRSCNVVEDPTVIRL